MCLRLLPVCVLCLLPVTSAAAQFSITQALSAPFSNQLTAAPAKARLAWFTDAEGRRNVWVGVAGETAHPVTHNIADDGQDIDDIAWSRDAEQLAWTRGTGSGGSDHTLAANPAELSGRVQQHVELVDLRKGPDSPVRTIAEGHTPLFLADGKHLLFLRRGAIWIADLQHTATASRNTAVQGEPLNGEEKAEQDTAAESSGIHQLLSVRGSAHGLRLSPDGSQLAFVSERGDHSFIGIYAFATGALTWMDPGTGLDHDPAWSPDSRQIAFIREVPIVSPIADRWMRDGQPWSLRIADTTTGNGREFWHADPGPGSLFHAVAARDQLLWMRDDRIVFPWEKGGWTRLYALPNQAATKSRTPQLLSPGDAEVDMVASDGSRVVWSSNAEDDTRDVRDVDRRHIFSDGGEGAQLTAGDHIETDPVILSDGTFALLHGDGQHPLVPSYLGDHGKLYPYAPQLLPTTFPAAQFVKPQQVVFPAADGMTIHGQLFLPRAANPGVRLPAVVFFHGGSRRQMLLGFHPMQYYHQAYAFNQYLASRGFVVLSVNYRSGVGYGLDFRQALHYGANGASEDNDVVGAAKFLRSRADVDPHRIGAWGGSYGGYLTALALARHSDLYAAGVDLHGVHDWSLELDLDKPSNDPGADQGAITRLAFASSPMASLDTWKSPVLLIQGDDDRNVLFAQTVRLAAELRRRGVPVEEKVFPDEVHDFLLHRNWITSYQLAADFLERHLQR